MKRLISGKGFRVGRVLCRGRAIQRDESRILTWSDDKTARIWPMDVDLDFPAEHVQLWLQAMTGSEFNFLTRQATTLPPDSWRKRWDRYEEIAARHALTCKYPDFNIWLLQPKQKQ